MRREQGWGRVGAILGVVLAVGLLTGCARVKPSFSGVLVNNWASDDKGAIKPQGRGLVFYNPLAQDLYIFPLHIQQQNYTVEGSNPITVRSGKDNTTVSFDATLMYQFSEERVSDIFMKYRTDPETLANGYVYRTVRSSFNEAASGFAVMDLLGAGLVQLQAKAEEILKQHLSVEGILVDQLLIVGQPRIDEKIEAAINQTLQAIQEANREEQRIRQATAKAEQQRQAAQGEADATLIRAKAEAQSAELLNRALTSTVLQQRALEKWNGTLPTVTGGGAIPFISVPTGKQVKLNVKLNDETLGERNPPAGVKPAKDKFDVARSWAVADVCGVCVAIAVVSY